MFHQKSLIPWITVKNLKHTKNDRNQIKSTVFFIDKIYTKNVSISIIMKCSNDFVLVFIVLIYLFKYMKKKNKILIRFQKLNFFVHKRWGKNSKYRYWFLKWQKHISYILLTESAISVSISALFTRLQCDLYVTFVGMYKKYSRKKIPTLLLSVQWFII